MDFPQLALLDILAGGFGGSGGAGSRQIVRKPGPSKYVRGPGRAINKNWVICRPTTVPGTSGGEVAAVPYLGPDRIQRTRGYTLPHLLE